MSAHVPKIVIDVIPHKKQRYNTSGDYFFKKGEWHIRISKMGSDHEFLVLMHELIELYLTHRKGVTIEEIDKFDMDFEKSRRVGDESEPGDDVRAPYYSEHQFAKSIERQLAKKLDVNWDKYDAHVKSL